MSIQHNQLIEAEWRMYASVKWPSLFQVMASRLVGAQPLSEPMLENCQFDLGNQLQWNFNLNSNIFIHENGFESVVCEMAATLSRNQCVK